MENNSEWIVGTGSSCHFYANKDVSVEFEEVNGGHEVHMRDDNKSQVLGKAKVLLKLTSGKSLALLNVLYVPSLCRNLISGSLRNKAGVKLVFDANKLVLTRNNELAGKVYVSYDMFVLDIVTPVSMNKIISSACIIESVNFVVLSFGSWGGSVQ